MGLSKGIRTMIVKSKPNLRSYAFEFKDSPEGFLGYPPQLLNPICSFLDGIPDTLWILIVVPMQRLRSSSIVYYSSFSSYPTDTFANLELRNPSHDVLELHKTRRSWSSKTVKGPVGLAVAAMLLPDCPCFPRSFQVQCSKINFWLIRIHPHFPDLFNSGQPDNYYLYSCQPVCQYFYIINIPPAIHPSILTPMVIWRSGRRTKSVVWSTVPGFSWSRAIVYCHQLFFFTVGQVSFRLQCVAPTDYLSLKSIV